MVVVMTGDLSMRRHAAPFLLSVAGLFLAVVAAPAAPAGAQSPAELLACVGVADNSERLACFDRAMIKTSPEARSAGERRAAEAATAAAAAASAAAKVAQAKAQADAAGQREAFGAEGISARADRFAPKPGETAAIEASIAEILTNNSLLGVFLLDNGQLWKQVDTARLPNARAGDKVTITRGGLGGYRLSFVRQKGWVLVKRLR